MDFTKHNSSELWRYVLCLLDLREEKPRGRVGQGLEKGPTTRSAGFLGLEP